MVTEIVDTHASDLANLVSAPSLTVPTTDSTLSATVTNTVTGRAATIHRLLKYSVIKVTERLIKCCHSMHFINKSNIATAEEDMFVEKYNINL